MGHAEAIRKPRASLAEYAHRWVFGWRMRGRGVAPENELTDRTFFHNGTKWAGFPHRSPTFAGRLLYIARWKHMAARHAYPTLAVLWFFSHALAILLALAGTGYFCWSMWRAARRRWLAREVTDPLHQACASLVELGDDVPAAEWLDVPKDFQRGGVITMRLPRKFPTYDEKRVDALVTQVAQVLGLAREDLRTEHKFSGKTPTLAIKVMPPPPKKVPWRTVVAGLPSLAPAEVLLGLGRGGEPIVADLDNEAPHILVSSGTGGGKSTTIRNILVQFLIRGAVGVILDPKRTSHRWARRCANVALLATPATMFHGLLALQAELDRRASIAEESDVEDEQPDTGKRIIIALEELNTLKNRLTTYWDQIKKADEWKDYTTNPALDALSELVQMGRFLRMHCIVVAQRASAQSFGRSGGDVRESFFYRILLQAHQQTWRMLVPGLKTADIPGISRKRGRGHLAFGLEHHLFQGVDLRETEAVQAATSGIVTKWRDVFSLDQVGTVPAKTPEAWDVGTGWDARTTYEHVTDSIAVAIASGRYDSVTEPPVSLREASMDHGRGIVPKSLDSLRKHRTRDRNKGWPSPVDMRKDTELYDVAQLRFFVANLERSSADRDRPGAHNLLIGGVDAVDQLPGDHVVPDGKQPVEHAVT